VTLPTQINSVLIRAFFTPDCDNLTWGTGSPIKGRPPIKGRVKKKNTTPLTKIEFFYFFAWHFTMTA